MRSQVVQPVRKEIYVMAKHLNPLEKEFLIHKYKKNPTIKLRDFCSANSVSDTAFKNWLKKYEEGGLDALARADAEIKQILPEGVEQTEESLRREILRLRIENERLKKNYMVRLREDGKMEYCRLKPKSSK